MQFLTMAVALMGSLALVGAQDIPLPTPTPVFACSSTLKGVCCKSDSNQNHCEPAGSVLGQNSCDLNSLPRNGYCCRRLKKNPKIKGPMRQGVGCTHAVLT